MTLIKTAIPAGAIVQLDTAKYPRLRTSSLDQAEVATLLGFRHYVEFDAQLGVNDERYFLFDMPLQSSGFVVALQNRGFQTEQAFAEFQILWDAVGFVAGNEIISFNENRIQNTPAKMKIYHLNGGEGGTIPTDDGTVRESGWAGASGGTPARSPGISPALGFRVYDESNFIFKLINGSTAQRVRFSYSWFEIPTSELVIV